ncbi:spinster family MFS transporter [Candidatus Phycosocius spiralis]|uniref:MFS transporter n=1 Tax=Candidatus Phycosocius spiralis TaxID=2815099 RepID=A0ABQ4PY20_9PROT|nr:MFS transporter [Candidatus Phycosocius spiralis]GIU67922.1 MFS transporter [Candidatus Phycosocius spiralis]
MRETTDGAKSVDTNNKMPLPTHEGPFSPAYVRYALWVLLVIYTLNFVDRQIVAILAEPIKQSLGLSDKQLGLLGGLAFAFFYTLLGIPIARIAERGNRVRIISIAVVVWSGFTAVSGAAQNFTHLLLSRIGVGVGEAGCTPPAHSLISDYVSPDKRASALAFYSLGVPIGSALGFIIGALIAQHFGWRTAFFAVGLPGIVIGILAWITLKEPRSLGLITKAHSSTAPSFKDALVELRSKKSYWYAVLAATTVSFLGYGHAYFLPSFLTRVHEMGLAERGGAMAGMTLVSGVVGTLIGGILADKAARKDQRAYMSVPLVAFMLGIPFFWLAMFAQSASIAILLLAIPTLLNSLWYGPVYAAVQSLVQPRTRATAVAIMLFVVNMIGLGAGPTAIGFFSDYFAQHHFLTLGSGFDYSSFCKGGAQTAADQMCKIAQAEGIRWSLLTTSSVGILAIIFFILARKTIVEDLQATEAEANAT